MAWHTNTSSSGFRSLGRGSRRNGFLCRSGIAPHISRTCTYAGAGPGSHEGWVTLGGFFSRKRADCGANSGKEVSCGDEKANNLLRRLNGWAWTTIKIEVFGCLAVTSNRFSRQLHSLRNTAPYIPRHVISTYSTGSEEHWKAKSRERSGIKTTFQCCESDIKTSQNGIREQW